MWQKIKKLTEHPMIVAIVSALLTFALSVFPLYSAGQSSIEEKYTEYVSMDSVDALLDTYFVQAGLLDPAVADYETVDEQFSALGKRMSDMDATINSALRTFGFSDDTLKQMPLSEKSSQISSKYKGVVSEKQQLEKEIKQLKIQNSEQSQQLDHYASQKKLELRDPQLTVDGELMINGDQITNAIALIDGNPYYSESMLNAYMVPDKNLQYSSGNNMILKGSAKPEKVLLSWNEMVYDSSWVTPISTGEENSLTMSKQTFKNGFVVEDESEFFIALNKNYSSLSFRYGHIDGSDRLDRKLLIYGLDDNNQYTTLLAEIDLIGESVPQNTGKIDLSYAQAIKIVITSDSGSPHYGFTDFYLYS